MSEDEEAALTDEELAPEVLAYAEAFAERLGDAMLRAADPRAAVDAFARELASDVGGLTLIHGAFEDGRRDALLTAARVVEEGGPSSDWDGVEGGERMALWRETHLCNGCMHNAVCVVQRAIPDELLVQIRRCLAFVPHGG